MNESDVWNQANYMEGENWVTIEVDEAPVVRMTHEGIKQRRYTLPAQATLLVRNSISSNSSAKHRKPSRVTPFLYATHQTTNRRCATSMKHYHPMRVSSRGLMKPGQDWDLEIRKAVKRAYIMPFPRFSE